MHRYNSSAKRIIYRMLRNPVRLAGARENREKRNGIFVFFFFFYGHAFRARVQRRIITCVLCHSVQGLRESREREVYFFTSIPGV
jgi:hypothetical protein